MNLYEKLHEIQCSVDRFLKDKRMEEGALKYDYVSSESVLDTIRPKMNELKLLLIPATTGTNVRESIAKSGSVRYLTELHKLFIWIDVESGERLEVPFQGQGSDLGGEKGIGKAETYAEKYFFLKFFHVPTSKDDPDGEGRTKKGEKKQKGTVAEKDTTEDIRLKLVQLLDEVCENNPEKIREIIINWSKSDELGIAGVDSLDKLSDNALRVFYGRSKKAYLIKFGKEFNYVPSV